MVVEMAVLAPVVIVMAVVVFNLMCFFEASALFDRVAPNAVLALAVSLDDGNANAERAVAAAIEGAMEGVRGVDVAVRAQTAWEAHGEGLGFSFAPHLTRYVCTMDYYPWPAALSVAGVEAGIPLKLSYSCAVVVDRYRPGVVF